MAVPAAEPAPEDAFDALVDGDRVLVRGTAQAALSHPGFRRVWMGTFASNVGTWMQNVLLGAYAFKISHGSEAYVGAIFFAQLGPLLLLSNVGGVLADVLDRRRLLLWAQVQQLVFSLVLAGVVASTDNPSRALLFGCVLVIGVGNALGAPALSAILPTLVPKPDLPGAVSLQSVQMNLSRVIGPVIGALLDAATSISVVFVLNAVTYFFAIGALLTVEYHQERTRITQGVLRRLSEGFRIARADPLVRRVLTTLFSMSLVSLMFVGLMPAVAERNFGIDSRSTQYGVLYAVFGLGAALGAVSVGTWLASVAKERLVRPAFLAFAAILAAFALTRTPWLAFVLAPLLGYAYFVVITSLSTVLQSHVDDAVRGRVMALWIMGFGGTVPVGVLIGGVIAHATSITAVLLFGAGFAVVLALYSDLAAAHS